MLYYIVKTGIVYSGETDEEAAERDRMIAEYNAAVDRELAAWLPAPMKGLEGWCRKHAPELLEPGGLERLRDSTTPATDRTLPTQQGFKAL